jgi:unsaturated rhamnogalacturonyl hydrolase
MLLGGTASAVLAAACGPPTEPGAPAASGLPPCAPRPAGPDEPFAAPRRDDQTRIGLATEVALRYVAEHDPTAMAWDWGEGVLMHGLGELYRVTAEPALCAFYRAWLDHHLALGYRHLLTTSDRCPPALTALALFAQGCEPRYGEVVLAVLDYLYERALRDAAGGINHLGTLDVFGISLWIDSLFMFGEVLTRWGELANDARALAEIGQQLQIFAAALQDDSGWFEHAAGWTVSEQDENVFWGRGNAWVTASGYDYLRVRKARGESDAAVAAILARQVEAIVASQDPASGLWWTVVNRPGETYLETSATALFAAGLARGLRHGLLSASVKPTIDLAIDGIGSRIVDGVVSGVSGPTTVGGFDDYAAIEQGDSIHYGVGAVLLGLVESAGL